MKRPKLYPYQKIGVFRILNRYHGRCLLADDVGLGKSVQALRAAEPLRRNRPIIIICPNTVKWSWEEEVHTHTDLQCWVLEGKKPPRRRPLYIPPVIILNWDILGAWEKFLKRLGAAVIIPDEIHFAKNRKAQRTKACRRLCRKAKFVIGLSGTPFENRPSELFIGLNIIRPDVFRAFVPFGRLHAFSLC